MIRNNVCFISVHTPFSLFQADQDMNAAVRAHLIHDRFGAASNLICSARAVDQKMVSFGPGDQ